MFGEDEEQENEGDVASQRLQLTLGPAHNDDYVDSTANQRHARQHPGNQPTANYQYMYHYGNGLCPVQI